MDNFSFFNSNFYQEKAILSSKKLVHWKKKNAMYNFDTLPKTAIISAVNFFSKKELFFLKKIKGFNGKAYLFNSILCILNIGIGAPSVISLMEELRELGVNKFIFIGYGARINNTINAGKIFMVSEAYSLTGTSLFYQKESFILYKTDLHDKINLEERKVLSVDAPFRETKRLLEKYQAKKVGLVDMETASILAFGKFYGISVCSILMSSDLLLPEWKAPVNLRKNHKKIKKIIQKLRV